MITLRTAAQQALEVLELEMDTRRCRMAITALRAALVQQAGSWHDGVLEGHLRERERWLAQEQAEPVQEPVKFWPLAPLTGYYDVGGKRVWLEKDDPFPASPQRKPLSLTDLQEALVYTNLINRDAIDNSEEYDEGSTLSQIDELYRIIERAHGVKE